MSDRKRMRKLREKRLVSVGRQIEKHKDYIDKDDGRLDVTKDYWQKEIDEKFLKQMEKDKKYLEEDDDKDGD